MKKCYFFLLLFVYLSASAQMVNGIPIKNIDVEYLQVTAYHPKLLSPILYAELDFGQEFRRSSDRVITDGNDVPIKFNSTISLFNMLSQIGYDYTDTYPMIRDTSSKEYFIFRKRQKNNPGFNRGL